MRALLHADERFFYYLSTLCAARSILFVQCFCWGHFHLGAYWFLSKPLSGHVQECNLDPAAARESDDLCCEGSPLCGSGKLRNWPLKLRPRFGCMDLPNGSSATKQPLGVAWQAWISYRRSGPAAFLFRTSYFQAHWAAGTVGTSTVICSWLF